MSTVWGKVYLVGAGPGDPGLITVRGRECLEHADAVIYDSLANEELLGLAPAHAERIFVGKSREHHTLLQEEINRLLIHWASRLSRVVRLKGGDPFVFGRGGEECLALAEAGVPFEVVPGVSAGTGAPAFAGIPVTHRGLAASVAFITGHGDPATGEPVADLTRVVTDGTLVFFMGTKNLPRIVDELIRLGRSSETPAAVVEWGTYPRQRTVVGSLATIAEAAGAQDVKPPSIVVVGDVVSLHDKIAWFESRPLFGRRIVVTRARAQAGELVRQLRELGADIFEFPTIRIEPPAEAEDFGHVSGYDWIVLTSVNGVEMLFDRMDALGQDGRDLAGVKLCAIGAATAEAVRKRFLKVDLMPEKYVAEPLLDALVEWEGGTLEGRRFLLPRADIARSFLPVELRKRGAEVRELVAYHTVMPDASNELADALVKYEPELVTFTSSSTVQNFTQLVGAERLARIADQAAFATIGPITQKTAENAGLTVSVQPDVHDIPHFVDAIVAWAKR